MSAVLFLQISSPPLNINVSYTLTQSVSSLQLHYGPVEVMELVEVAELVEVMEVEVTV